MDELALSVAVVSMDVESEASKENEQETTAGGCSSNPVQHPAPEPSRADKEIEHSHPEQQRAGADNQKVPVRPRMQSHTPCATSFTRCWHPTDLPRGLPFAVPVDTPQPYYS